MSIDVIIPIYNAHDDLVRCIDSVLRCTIGEYRLLLINDASPDERIAPLLDWLKRNNPGSAWRPTPQSRLYRNREPRLWRDVG